MIDDRVRQEAEALEREWAQQGDTGIQPRLLGRGRRTAARLGPGRAHPRPTRRRAPVAPLAELPYVAALGALTGNQAVQMVKAGLEAIYLCGWQVAGDANLGEKIYPDQSLYPANSVPAVVRRINNALRRADQIQWSEGTDETDWLVPIVADAEAGFGGALNAFELMKAMIEAGAAGVHFEDQLASEKKCGHLGGKVLVPTAQFIRTLIAARLAADVLGVPTVLIARTDRSRPRCSRPTSIRAIAEFITGERTAEGFFVVAAGSRRRSPARSPTRRMRT